MTPSTSKSIDFAAQARPRSKGLPFAPATASALLAAVVWWGIVAGLVEGIGLLIFQRVNWARWGPMMHVSAPILWISPIVDVIFFAIAALLTRFLALISPRLLAIRVAVFFLPFLASYDWLTLTGRLYHRACLLLALGVAVAFTRWFGARELRVIRFWKNTAPWLVSVWALVFVVIQGGSRLYEERVVAKLPAAAPGSPNVLVIVVDTLRADHVSAYGYSRPTTPNLDRIAAQGVLFENAISTSSWSLPSHVSLVTGTYLFQHGVGNVEPEPWLGWGGNSLGRFPTLGESLAQKGYRTGAFSANRTYFSHDLGFGRAFVHFEDYFHSPADMFVRTLYGREFSRTYLIRSDQSLVKRILRALHWDSLLDQDSEGSGSYGGAFGIRKHADVVNEEVLDWIDRDRERPFLAFLNYFDVHDPYGGPKNYPKPSWRQATASDAYDDGVKYVDDYLVQLMRALEKRDLAKNTLVVITSDHGEALGQHYLETHGRSLYLELVRVPLILWWPGRVPAGMRLTQPVTNAAIPASILNLATGSSTAWLEQTSLVPLWKSPQVADWQDPLSELTRNKYPGRHDKDADQFIPTATTGAMEAITTSHWQLIRHANLGDQIYDLAADPAELNNLINTPAGKAAAAELAARITQLKAESVPSHR